MAVAQAHPNIARHPDQENTDAEDLTVNGDRVELFAPLMKFDERTGEFGAWSSVEEVDAHGEICDIDKSWPAIIAAAKDQYEISGGKSVGNLRRQHRRDTAIGKLTLIERRDREGLPGIWIEGLCTDEQSRDDAATGVLTGVSIRGLATRWPDEQNTNVMRYAWTLREEDSLVDRPAVPHALIEVMKSDGGIEMVKAAGRQPTQFWDCGNGAACASGCKHAKKEEAQKCEGLPQRIEATKSLWSAADLISVLSTLLCVTDDAEWNATWDAIDAQREGVEPDESMKTVIAQLKEIAGKLFDALQAMLEAERAKLPGSGDDEPALADGEMAMSLTMRAVANADDATKAKIREVAKQFTNSLRVPPGNGSNATLKEGTVKDPKDTKKEDGAVTPEQIAEVMATLKTIQGSIADIGTRLKTLEDAETVDQSAAADTAKAAVAQLAALVTRVEEIGKQAAKIDDTNRTVADLSKSLEDLGSSFETVASAIPVQRKGQLRAADKATEMASTDTGKAAVEDKVNPWANPAKAHRVG